MISISPEKTFAIVVGIERYDAGDNWSLDGPAADACRFVELLRGSGVPAANISLHLSTLAKNSGMPLPEGLAAQEATRECFDQLLTQTLPGRSESLLVFYWGGHGVMQADGMRYLFTQDANSANKRTVCLNDMLKFLRTSAIPASAFSQQIVIVDACANYVEPRTIATALTSIPFPFGNSTIEARTQFSLLAARPGEKASNINAEQTGQFSRELRTLLAAQPAEVWPPDMETLTKSLIERFVTLRNEGKTKQTPAYFSAGQWGTSERTLGTVSMKVEGAQTQVTLSMGNRQRLVKALSRCPIMMDYTTRKSSVLSQVRSEITARIADNQTGLLHADAIVSTCIRYTGGLTELLRAVRFYDEGSDEMTALDALVKEILPQVHAASLMDPETE